MFFGSLFASENGRFGPDHVGEPVGVDVGIFDLGGHALVVGQIAVRRA